METIHSGALSKEGGIGEVHLQEDPAWLGRSDVKIFFPNPVVHLLPSLVPQTQLENWERNSCC